MRAAVLLFAALVSSSEEVVGGNRAVYDEGGASMADVKAGIEENFEVDDAHPPYHDVVLSSESPCLWNMKTVWGGCDSVSYFLRNEVLGHTARVTAYAQINVEGRDQADETAVDMTLSESTAVLDSVSHGWSAAAHLSVNPIGLFGGSVSYERSEQRTRTRTVTREYARRYACPAWHRCQLQTWAWHVRITAACQRTAILRCAFEVRVCDATSLACPAYEAFRKQWCPYLPIQGAERCTLSVPLYDQAGKPISEVRRLAWDRRPQFVGCKRTWARISTGELWDAVTRFYFNDTDAESAARGWYAKASTVPPPNVPRPFPCVRSPEEAAIEKEQEGDEVTRAVDAARKSVKRFGPAREEGTASER
ncbi:hypothetical protein CDD83_11160 [Cordyceps sp. RAO-2017]|nr:hypothetical protein CDD83_11160 [Cordyceps sp. RAO-2017]